MAVKGIIRLGSWFISPFCSVSIPVSIYSRFCSLFVSLQYLCVLLNISLHVSVRSAQWLSLHVVLFILHALHLPLSVHAPWLISIFCSYSAAYASLTYFIVFSIPLSLIVSLCSARYCIFVLYNYRPILRPTARWYTNVPSIPR